MALVANHVVISLVFLSCFGEFTDGFRVPPIRESKEKTLRRRTPGMCMNTVLSKCVLQYENDILNIVYNIYLVLYSARRKFETEIILHHTPKFQAIYS